MDKGASSSRQPRHDPRSSRNPRDPRYHQLAQQDADYFNMIPSRARPFEGRQETMPFRHWIAQTIIWMDAIQMPHPLRAAAAGMLLGGEALEFWTNYPIDHNRDSWEEFQTVMTRRFEAVGARSLWYREVQYFAQLVGELIETYVERFYTTIVDTCPFRLHDWERRDIFVRGLQPTSIPPGVDLNTMNFLGVRRAIEEYDRATHAVYGLPFPVNPVVLPDQQAPVLDVAPLQPEAMMIPPQAPPILNENVIADFVPVQEPGNGIWALFPQPHMLGDPQVAIAVGEILAQVQGPGDIAVVHPPENEDLDDEEEEEDPDEDPDEDPEEDPDEDPDEDPEEDSEEEQLPEERDFDPLDLEMCADMVVADPMRRIERMLNRMSVQPIEPSYHDDTSDSDA